jgi:multidrug efflux pump subunit AcrB
MTEIAIFMITFAVAIFIIIVIGGVIFYRRCQKDQSPSDIEGLFSE